MLSEGAHHSVKEHKEHQQLVLIRMYQNRGYAAAINVGLEFALSENKYSFVWVLNNDTNVDAYALEALRSFAKDHSEMAMIGSTIAEYYKPDTIQCAGGWSYNKWICSGRPLHKGEMLNMVPNLPEMKMDYIYGAAMFISVESIRRVGLFEEAYFLYFEEPDYVQRLRREGYDIGWCKLSTVYHKGGGSIGTKSLKNPVRSYASEFYSDLSALKYTKKFYPDMFYIVAVLRLILKASKISFAREWQLFRPLIRAYVTYFRGAV